MVLPEGSTTIRGTHLRPFSTHPAFRWAPRGLASGGFASTSRSHTV